MTFNEMQQAIDEANATLNRADYVVGRMARMCAGRLRKSDVSSDTLKQLKRELKNFNIHTGKWNNHD